MAIERTYNVPLRTEWLKVPKYRRAKKAMTALRQFLVKHMKSENVKIGKYANELVWERGIKSPPHHIKVNVTKDDEGKVYAELVGAPVEAPKEEPKKKKAEDREKKKEEIKKKLEDLKKQKEAKEEKAEEKTAKKSTKKNTKSDE